jgi:hypothetical protein
MINWRDNIWTPKTFQVGDVVRVKSDFKEEATKIGLWNPKMNCGNKRSHILDKAELGTGRIIYYVEFESGERWWLPANTLELSYD